MKSILEQFVRDPVPLPAALLKQFEESKTRALYLLSCIQQGRIFYLSPQFEKITGHSVQKFKNGGIDFWFSLIHPADMQGVVNAITRAHHELAITTPPAEPMRLEYRVKRGDGKWLWLRELKCIVSYHASEKDFILGCFCDITAENTAEQAGVEEILQTGAEANGLLKKAVAYQLDEDGNRKADHPAARLVSGREKEVLKLVAAGHSSKQIADRLSISENTVETHRRHLLEKLKVNNSTALVKAAHELGLL